MTLPILLYVGKNASDEMVYLLPQAQSDYVGLPTERPPNQLTSLNSKDRNLLMYLTTSQQSCAEKVRYHVQVNKGQWAYANRFGLLAECPDLFITKTLAMLHLDPIQYIFSAWVVFGLEKRHGLLDFIGVGFKLGSLAGTNAYAAPQSVLVPKDRLPLETDPPGYETRFLPSQSFRKPVRLCERVSYKIYIRELAMLPSTELGPVYLRIAAYRSTHHYSIPHFSHKAFKLHLLHFLCQKGKIRSIFL